MTVFWSFSGRDLLLMLLQLGKFPFYPQIMLFGNDSGSALRTMFNAITVFTITTTTVDLIKTKSSANFYKIVLRRIFLSQGISFLLSVFFDSSTQNYSVWELETSNHFE